jgi:hypothetical protein
LLDAAVFQAAVSASGIAGAVQIVSGVVPDASLVLAGSERRFHFWMMSAPVSRFMQAG